MNSEEMLRKAEGAEEQARRLLKPGVSWTETSSVHVVLLENKADEFRALAAIKADLEALGARELEEGGPVR